MDSTAVYRGVWHLPACFACYDRPSNHLDLEVNHSPACTCLVCNAPNIGFILRGRGWSRVAKDAEFDPMAVASRVDLDPAGVTARWRGPF